MRWKEREGAGGNRAKVSEARRNPRRLRARKRAGENYSRGLDAWGNMD